MDFFHMPIQIISRDKGRSAVAAAAYRSGTRLDCTWDGRTHDYTRKNHIVYSEIMLPPQAPREFYDRATLWNSVEWNEPKRNNQLAREMELSLPAELSREEQIKLVQRFVQKTFVDDGMCADFSVHDKNDGNPHVHIMLTMRPLTEDGQWDEKSKMVYELDENGERIKLPSGNWKSHKEYTTDWDNRKNAEKWRTAAADFINESLRENGFTSGFVDHRSYARQGKKQIPMVHEGPEVREMEKRGIRTELGDQNCEIRSWNRMLKQYQARLARLNAWSTAESQAAEYAVKNGTAEPDSKLSYRFMLNIMNAHNPENRKDNRLQDATSVHCFMLDYGIQDEITYNAAVKEVNDQYYMLRSKIVEGEQMISMLNKRIQMAEDLKQFQSVHNKYEKLPVKKKDAYYDAHRMELTRYDAAERFLTQCRADGETVSIKKWKEALKYCERDKFFKEYEMKEFKKKIHILELIKREFVRDKSNDHGSYDQSKEHITKSEPAR